MIHIFYRTTLHNKPNNLRPSWFSYEECFRNLQDSVAGFAGQCQINVIFDGGEEEYKQSYLAFRSRYTCITAGSDLLSNVMTFEHIKGLDIPDKDLIYVLENDYLHVNGWVSHVQDLFDYTGGNHYVSLFDHNDKYLFRQNREDEWGMYKNLTSQIIVAGERHWRTVPNTCASFLMTGKMFKDDYDILSLNEADNTRFNKLVTEKNRVVLTPIPGLATHVQNPWMSPCVDWEAISDSDNFKYQDE